MPSRTKSFAKGLRNYRFVDLSSGAYYLQEDDPVVIGANLKEWLVEWGIASRKILNVRL